MSVWTSTVMASRHRSERPTSSASTTEARASRPAPPMRLGDCGGEEASSPISRAAPRAARARLLPLRPVRIHLLLAKRAELGADEVVVLVKMGCAMAAGVLHCAESRDKRLQDRSIYPHWCTDTVRFSDQDAAGHVNNVAICAYSRRRRLTFRRHGLMTSADGTRGISSGMTVSFLADRIGPGQVELGTGVMKIAPAPSPWLGGVQAATLNCRGRDERSS